MAFTKDSQGNVAHVGAEALTDIDGTPAIITVNNIAMLRTASYDAATGNPVSGGAASAVKLLSTSGTALDTTAATANTTATPLLPVKILGAGGNSPTVNLSAGVDALRNQSLAPDSTALAVQAQTALAATNYAIPSKAVGPAGKDVAATLGTTSGFQVVQVDASGNQIPRVSTNGTLLASAARTATPTIAGQINPASSGTLFILTITANASVAGVKFSVNAQDGLGNSAAIYTGAALTTVGTFYYYFGTANGGLIGTGGTSGLTGGLQLPLPRLYQPIVTHLDASSVTYSLVAAVLA